MLPRESKKVSLLSTLVCHGAEPPRVPAGTHTGGHAGTWHWALVPKATVPGRGFKPFCSTEMCPAGGNWVRDETERPSDKRDGVGVSDSDSWQTNRFRNHAGGGLIGTNLLSWNSPWSGTGNSVNLFPPLAVCSGISSTVQTIWVLLLFRIKAWGKREGEGLAALIFDV